MNNSELRLQGNYSPICTPAQGMEALTGLRSRSPLWAVLLARNPGLPFCQRAALGAASSGACVPQISFGGHPRAPGPPF